MPIKITPIIMPIVDWPSIVSVYRREHLPNPVTQLTNHGIKLEDPSSLVFGLDAGSQCYLAFLIEAPVHYALVLSDAGVTIKKLHVTVDNTLIFIAGACFTTWKYVIIEDKEALIFEEIKKALERTGLKPLLRG